MIWDWLAGKVIAYAQKRPAGDIEGYMERFWLVRPASRQPWVLMSWRQRARRILFPFGVRVHHILRSDPDDLHDHPWWNMSLILRGYYWEVTPRDQGMPGASDSLPHNLKTTLRARGQIAFRKAEVRHRILVQKGHTCWTIFIMGPKFRDWGFHTSRGWIHWESYVDQRGSDSPFGGPNAHVEG